jgi:hypothetical protein
MTNLRKYLIFWTLFIGIGALWGSFIMWFDSTGAMWGMQEILPMLQVLPFADFFFQDFKWSGLALLLVNGIPQITAAVLLFKKHCLASLATMVCGIFLILWIMLQFIIFPLNLLSSLYFVFGCTEFLLAFFYWRKIKRGEKCPSKSGGC